MKPRATVLAIAVCAALGSWAGSRAAAQAPPALAGVVVRFEGGEVQRRCVDLGARGEMTGLEALQATGLALAFEAQANGALVCQIEGEGCAYPAEACLCQCQSLGEGCRYWAYYSLAADGWRYENRGPLGRRLRHGDVDGWAWGPGTEGSGQRPPASTFEELCAERLATTTPTSSASPSPRPSPTPRPSATARPTPTSRPGASPRPSATAMARPPTAAGPTARPTATAKRAGSAAALVASPTPGPAYPGPDEVRATLAAYPTRLAELRATAEARLAAGGPAATEVPTSAPPSSTPTRAPARTATTPAPSPTPRVFESAPERNQGRRGGDALLTAAILGLLGLAWWRSRGL